MKKFNKNDLKEFILGPFLLVFAFVLIICSVFWLSSLTSHASSVSTNLPYVVQNNVNYLSSSEISELQTYLDSYGVDLVNDNIIIFKSYEAGWYNNNSYFELPTYRVLKCFDTSVSGTWSNNSNFDTFELYNSSYYIDSSFDISGNYLIRLREIPQVLDQTNGLTSFNKQLFGNASLSTVSSGLFEGQTWNNNYPVYISTDFTSYNFIALEEGKIIVNYVPTEPNYADSGHATGNSTFDNPYYDHNLPNSIPDTPSFSGHSLSGYTPPAVDNSSTNSLLDSLINTIDSLGSFLSAEINSSINNVGSYIQNAFSALAQIINYGFHSVVNSLVQIGENFINNIVSLFVPIAENLARITTFYDSFLALGFDENGDFSIVLLFRTLFIPSLDDLVNLIVMHDIFGLVAVINHLLDVIQTFFLELAHTTPIHVLTIPAFTFMGVTCGPYDIDFGWYASYKSIGDGIISAFLILGYFYWLLTHNFSIL